MFINMFYAFGVFMYLFAYLLHAHVYIKAPAPQVSPGPPAPLSPARCRPERGHASSGVPLTGAPSSCKYRAPFRYGWMIQYVWMMLRFVG
jgi:hypothetical protein